MTAIEASAVRCRTMADGSLRVEFEVEPRHSRDAFALFGSPGTPVALAALKTTAQQEQAEKLKGREIAKWLGMRCDEPAFQDWLKATFWTLWHESSRGTVARKDIAAETVRRVCQVESRADIDNDIDAAQRFNDHIRFPWQRHCIAAGITR